MLKVCKYGLLMVELPGSGGEMVCLAEACSRLGLRYKTAVSRVRHGATPQEAIETGLRKNKKHMVELPGSGGEKVSLSEACRLLNLRYRTAVSRIRHGATPQEAIERALPNKHMVEIGLRKNKKHMVELPGDEMVSLSEACRLLDLRYRTAVSRIRRGATPQEAIETGLRKNKKHMVELPGSGGEMVCLAEACRRLGLNCRTLRDRIRRGATPQEAIERGLHMVELPGGLRISKYNKHIVELPGSGGEMVCLAEACSLLGLRYLTVSKRIKNGATPQEAIEKGLSKYNKHMVELPGSGGEMVSLFEACRRLDLKYGTIRYRITKLGATPQEAIERALPNKHMVERALPNKHMVERALPNKHMVELPGSGGEMVCLAEACSLLDLNYGTVFSRIKRGATPQEAIEKGLRKYNKHMVELPGSGGEMVCLAEACRLLDLSYVSVKDRIRHGATPQEAIERGGRRNKQYNKHMVELPGSGKKVSLPEACRLLDLKYGTIHYRITKLGATPQEAIERGGRWNKHMVELPGSGKKVSLSKACRLLDLKYGTIYYRITKLGVTPQEAIERGLPNKYMVELPGSGGEMVCLAEACSRLGLRYRNAVSRIRHGATPQEAIERGLVDRALRNLREV